MFRVSGLREIEQVVEKECPSAPADAAEPTSEPETSDPFTVEARKWDVLSDEELWDSLTIVLQEDAYNAAVGAVEKGRQYALELLANTYRTSDLRFLEQRTDEFLATPEVKAERKERAASFRRAVEKERANIAAAQDDAYDQVAAAAVKADRAQRQEPDEDDDAEQAKKIKAVLDSPSWMAGEINTECRDIDRLLRIIDGIDTMCEQITDGGSTNIEVTDATVHGISYMADTAANGLRAVRKNLTATALKLLDMDTFGVNAIARDGSLLESTSDQQPVEAGA